MRALTCGRGGLLLEVDGLDAAMRLYRALSVATDGAADGTDAAADSAAAGPFAAVTQLIPAARTVFVGFDPLRATRAALVAAIRALDADGRDGARPASAGRTVTLPVVYDGEDLDAVADLLGVSRDQVVARHTGHDWSVAFVGFAPGFAYLAGGDPLFDVPRRATPRLAVPAGAVGLAGTFSGVYPRRSSGGWQLIGTAATPVWDEAADPPALLRPGDAVRFRAVRPTAAAVASRPAAAAEPAGTAALSGTSAPSETAPSAGTVAPDRTEAPSIGSPALEVVRPGILAVFEDGGRHAADMGATGSGAANPTSLHLANALAGNAPSAPALELTGGCAAFRAHGDLVLAVAGAPASVTVAGAATPPFELARQEAFLLRDGETVALGAPETGLRTYLAARGGFAVRATLDSASTDTMSGIGPRPLRAGDLLPLASAPRAGSAPAHTVGAPEPWPRDLPRHGAVTTLAVTLGPRDDWFTPAGLAAFLATCWTVTTRSNRVGLRLAGGRRLERIDARHELASEATVPGAIEVPSDGLPVVFLRDQPVTGGYPVIAVLTPEALDLAGQLPPGALVRFIPDQSPQPTEGALR